MGVRLEVTIAGLFLIVDDVSKGLTHVIAPRTSGFAHGHEHGERGEYEHSNRHGHDPNERNDKAPDRESADEVARAVPPASSHKEHQTWIVGESSALRNRIDGFILDFSGLVKAKTPRCDIRVSGAIRLGDCADGQLDNFHHASLAATPRPKSFCAHIILPSGLLVGERRTCIVEGRSKRPDVATVLRWVVELPDDRATIDLPGMMSLDGVTKAPGLGSVAVNKQTGAAWLAICNVVAEAVPTHPGQLYGPAGRLEAGHYAAFRQFWTHAPSFDLKSCKGDRSVYSDGERNHPYICPPPWVIA
jgi:hypothetical protein